MSINPYIFKSFLCFIGVFILYRYDIWWYKNKVKKEQLGNFDKTVRPIKNIGLKVMLLLLGLILLSKAFIK